MSSILLPDNFDALTTDGSSVVSINGKKFYVGTMDEDIDYSGNQLHVHIEGYLNDNKSIGLELAGVLSPPKKNKSNYEYSKQTLQEVLLKEYANKPFLIDLQTANYGGTYTGSIYLWSETNRRYFNLESELVKRKAVYLDLYRVNTFANNDTETRELFHRQVLSHMEGTGTGIYSSAVSLPYVFQNDKAIETNSLYQQFLRDQLYRNSSIKNKGVLSLFNKELNTQGFLVSSRYGASYFHNVALYNVAQQQIGGEKFDFRSEGVAVRAYYLAQLANGDSVEEAPAIVRWFDVSTQRPGLGAWLNETLFIPAGMGRVYKEELGFLGSAAALVGKVLDQTVNYFGSDSFFKDRADLMIAPIDIQQTAISEKERPGFFEQLLPSAVNSVLTTSASVLTYYAVAVPLGYWTADLYKNFLTQMTDMFNSPNGVIGRTVSTALLFGSESATLSKQQFYDRVYEHTKHQVLNEIKLDSEGKFEGVVKVDLTDMLAPTFSMPNFNNFGYRNRGSYLIDTVINAFIDQAVNPYQPGSERWHKLVKAQNDFVEAVRKPIRFEAHLAVTQMTDKDKKVITAIDGAKSMVSVDSQTVGSQRNKNIVYRLQDMIDLLPLNPANWKWGGRTIDPNKPFMTMGDLLNFADLTKDFQDMFKNPRVMNNFVRLSGSTNALSYLGNTVTNAGRFIGAVARVVYADVSLYSSTFLEREFSGRANKVRQLQQQLINSGVGSTNYRRDADVLEVVESPNGRTSSRYNFQKTLDFIDDVPEEALNDLADLIIEAGENSERYRNVEQMINKKHKLVARSTFTRTVTEQFSTRNVIKNARRNKGRLAAFMLEADLVKNVALFGASVSYFFLNQIFNSSKGASILEQYGTQIAIWDKGGAVQFESNNLISTSYGWVAATTALTVLTSGLVGLSVTNVVEEELMVRGLSESPDAKFSKHKLIAAMENKLQGITDLTRRETVTSIIDRYRNMNLTDAGTAIRIDNPVKVSKALSASLMTYLGIQVGFKGVSMLAATAGNLINTLNGRQYNLLHQDITSVSLLSEFKADVMQQIAQGGPVNDVVLTGAFNVDFFLNNFNLVQDSGSVGKQIRMFAMQAPSQVFQMFTGFSFETYFKDGEQKKKVLMRFGLQGNPQWGINFGLSSPFAVLPDEQPKDGFLGGSNRFVWNSDSSNFLSYLITVGEVGFKVFAGLALVRSVVSMMGFPSEVLNNTVKGSLFGSVDEAVKGSIREVHSVIDSLAKVTLGLGTVVESLIDVTANTAYKLTGGVNFHSYDRYRRAVIKSAKLNKPTRFSRVAGAFAFGVMGFQASNYLLTTVSEYIFGRERPTSLENFQEVLSANVIPIAGGLAGGLYGALLRYQTVNDIQEQSTRLMKLLIHDDKKITALQASVFPHLKNRKSYVESRFISGKKHPFIRAAAPIYVGMMIGTYMFTDSKFGKTVDMDTDPVQRVATMLTTSVIVGSAFTAGYRLRANPTTLAAVYEFTTVNKGSVLHLAAKQFNRVLNVGLTRYLEKATATQSEFLLGLLRDVSYNGLKAHGDAYHYYKTEQKRFLDQFPLDNSSADNIREIKEAFDLHHLSDDEVTDLVKRLRDLGNPAADLAQNTADQFFNKNFIISGATTEVAEEAPIRKLASFFEAKDYRNYINRKGRGMRFKGTVMGFVAVAAASKTVELVANIVGGVVKKRTYVEGSNLDSFYAALDRPYLEFLADTVRLVTGKDRAGVTALTELSGNQLVNKSGIKLIKATSPEVALAQQYFDSVLGSVVLDPSNVFFSFNGTNVGISVRERESGLGITPYAQFQTAGFDMSTAVYSLARKYSFGSNYGSLKRRMVVEREIARFTNNASFNELRGTKNYEMLGVITNRISASLDPLVGSNRRKFSKVLDIYQTKNVSSSVIATYTVKSRVRDLKQASYQPIESLLNRSVNLNDVSMYNVLTEAFVANAAVNDPVLHTVHKNRQAYIRLAYHLKNSFNHNTTVKALNIAQSKLAGNDLNQDDISSFEFVTQGPTKVENAFGSTIIAAYGNLQFLVNRIVGWTGLAGVILPAVGISSVAMFASAVQLGLNKVNAPNEMREMTILQNMFGYRGEYTNISPISKLSYNASTPNVLYVENTAPIFSRQLGNPTFTISIDRNAFSKEIRETVDLSKVAQNIHSNLNNLYSQLDAQGGPTHKLWTSLEGIMNKDSVYDANEKIKNKRLLSNFNSARPIIDVTVFKEDFQKVVDQYVNDIFQLLNDSKLHIDNETVRLFDVIQLDQSLENVKNVFVEEIKDNVSLYLDKMLDMKPVISDEQTVMVGQMKGFKPKDTNNAISLLVRGLINEGIQEQLRMVQQGLVVLKPTDPNVLRAISDKVLSVAKSLGGVMQVGKPKSNPLHLINKPRTIKYAGLPDLEVQYNSSQLRRTKSTISRHINQFSKLIGTSFNVLSTFGDFVDSYGYTVSLGNAIADKGYTDSETDYLALEAANAQVNAVMLSSTYSLMLQGVIHTPQFFSAIAAKMPFTVPSIPSPWYVKVGVGVLTVGVGVALSRNEQARNTFSKYVVSPINSLTKAVSDFAAPTLADLQKSYISANDSPAWNRFASGNVAGVSYGLQALSLWTIFNSGIGTTTAAATSFLGVSTAVGTGIGLAGAVATAVGAGIVIAGVLIGAALLFGLTAALDRKGRISNLLMSINRRLSKIPVLGMIISTPEDDSLKLIDDVSSGPIFFGTARQAVQNSVEQFYFLADDLNSSGTSNYLFGPSLNNLANSSSTQVAGLETSPINMNSNILNAALLDRAKYFRQQIVGHSIYMRELEKVKNARQLKEQLLYDTFQKNSVVDAVKNVEQLQRKDLEQIQTGLKAGDEQALAVVAASLRNSVAPVGVDTTKQVKKKAVFESAAIKNKTVSFNKQVIESTLRRPVVFAETVSVNKDGDTVEVKRDISKRNDLIAGVVGRNIPLNAYL